MRLEKFIWDSFWFYASYVKLFFMLLKPHKIFFEFSVNIKYLYYQDIVFVPLCSLNHW